MWTMTDLMLHGLFSSSHGHVIYQTFFGWALPAGLSARQAWRWRPWRVISTILNREDKPHYFTRISHAGRDLDQT
jgi:hypothetical protein